MKYSSYKMTHNGFHIQFQQLKADGYIYRARLPINDEVWMPLPNNNRYKLLIIYDKPPTKNSESEVETYYKTFEIRTYDRLASEFYCLESCTEHYYGADNPTYIHFIDDVLVSLEDATVQS